MVSIIIPTLNRCDQLNRTLFSLVNLKTHRGKFEILVIDNGSTDATVDVIRKYRSENPEIELRYFFDTIPGLLTGRHRGIKEAKGEILSFIDDDVFVSTKWLDSIINVMAEREDISFLTGPNLPLYESYPPNWLDCFWSPTEYGGRMCGWLSLLDLGKGEKEIHPNYVWGLNFIVRKKDLIELGGFHPDSISNQYQMFQGDGETGLTIKAYENGKKALYHSDVILYHQIPNTRLTFDYFDKRAFYQGVCDSFTTLRKNIKTDYNFTNQTRKSYLSRFITYSKKYLSIKKVPKIINQDLSVLLKARFSQKQIDGYKFHQHIYDINPKVKDWVHRENYFDYQLPQ